MAVATECRTFPLLTAMKVTQYQKDLGTNEKWALPVCPSIANSPDLAKPVHPTVEVFASASSARGYRYQPATSHQSSDAV